VAQHANTGDDGSLGKRDDKRDGKRDGKRDDKRDDKRDGKPDGKPDGKRDGKLGNQRTDIHQRLVNLVKSI
jgi:hypothetical protein